MTGSCLTWPRSQTLNATSFGSDQRSLGATFIFRWQKCTSWEVSDKTANLALRVLSFIVKQQQRWASAQPTLSWQSVTQAFLVTFLLSTYPRKTTAEHSSTGTLLPRMAMSLPCTLLRSTTKAFSPPQTSWCLGMTQSSGIESFWKLTIILKRRPPSRKALGPSKTQAVTWRCTESWQKLPACTRREATALRQSLCALRGITVRRRRKQRTV
mmetsp:Transcript_32321/g.81426  ORF Transcript_32321/g.81426 Transcript_32321/m.81426 type:complete len:212 (+) Transcript_32321:897-1532(+)